MPKDWKGVLVRRAGQDAIYFSYKESRGWVHPASPYLWSKPGDEELARKALNRICRALKDRKPFQDAAGSVTVRSFAAQWLEKRPGTSKADDEQRLRDHAFPAIGDLPIADVRPKHLLRLMQDLKTKKATRTGHGRDADGNQVRVAIDEPLAPRTIRKVYSALRSMFRDALIEELIEGTPCVLTGAHLPSAKDKDPEWRDRAVFDLAEVSTLVYDQAIPQDRRVCYALYFLGCTRFGEAAAIRWRHYDPVQLPLGMLRIAKSYSTRLKLEKDTKAERPRRVPVTPQLAAILADWKLRGWPAMFGRKPEADDLIVPASTVASDGQLKNRNAHHMLKKFHQDCTRVGFRERRQHDSRRTWLSVVLAAGANETHAKWIAHGPPQTVMGAYMSMPWTTLCAVVRDLRLPTPSSRLAVIGE